MEWITSTFNGRMTAIIIGLVLVCSVIAVSNGEEINIFLYAVRLLIMSIGGVLTLIGMLGNHTSNKLANVTPTLYGVIISCVALIIEI
ncbi:MAG: hypothetical protein ACI8Q1_003608 [Parvicella sp.]|jgi:hypothetical protein